VTPPKKCQLCGKTDEDVDTWVGGYLNHAHHKCAEIGHKAVYLYLRSLYYDMWGLKMLAEDIIKLKEKEERVR